MVMYVVLPFHFGDSQQALNLLRWVKDLGGAEKYHCLLVADMAVGWQTGLDVMNAAKEAFASATIITNEKAVTSWPEGANSLFFTAARFIQENVKSYWIWLEPDCVPMRSGWLREIEDHYMLAGQLFLGHIYKNTQPEFPREVMSGIAVYPANTAQILFEVQAIAWDVHHAQTICDLGANTNLIYAFWGQKDLAPTFVEFKGHNDPVNAMVLENIPKEAVLYHRNKDGTLINLLRRKLFPTGASTETPAVEGGLLAVIAFCGKDAEAALRNVTWMRELGGVKTFQCLLSYDDYTNRSTVGAIRKIAEEAFGSVAVNAYRTRTDMGWPDGANEAFKSAARYAETHFKIPWLWIEADAVPIKSDWMDVICFEYYKHGKSFYAPIVPHLNHQNGVGVYPWNTASRCPKIMSATNTAWDYFGASDMVNDRKDAEPFIQHAWGAKNGQPHPIEGEPIRFNSVDEVRRWIKPDARLFHRAKYGDLQQRLREMKNAH